MRGEKWKMSEINHVQLMIDKQERIKKELAEAHKHI